MMAGPVWADDWRILDGPAITLALSSRALSYEDGSSQNFFADGATSYKNGTTSLGRWQVLGDEYCSQWPPSDRWACYAVKAEAAGLDLRFVAADGSSTQGRYIDLN